MEKVYGTGPRWTKSTMRPIGPDLPSDALDACPLPRPGHGMAACCSPAPSPCRSSSSWPARHRLGAATAPGPGRSTITDVTSARVRPPRHRVQRGTSGHRPAGARRRARAGRGAGTRHVRRIGRGRRCRHGRPRERAIHVPAGRAAGASWRLRRGRRRARDSFEAVVHTAPLLVCTSAGSRPRRTSTRSTGSARSHASGSSTRTGRSRRRPSAHPATGPCADPWADRSRPRSGRGSIRSPAHASCTTAPTSASRAAPRSTQLVPERWWAAASAARTATGSSSVTPTGSRRRTTTWRASRWSVGQRVTTSTIVGRVGSTGLSTGCHLHFMARRNGTLTDPMTLL